jgi:hypothetical protein
MPKDQGYSGYKESKDKHIDGEMPNRDLTGVTTAGSLSSETHE